MERRKEPPSQKVQIHIFLFVFNFVAELPNAMEYTPLSSAENSNQSALFEYNSLVVDEKTISEFSLKNGKDKFVHFLPKVALEQQRTQLQTDLASIHQPMPQ